MAITHFVKFTDVYTELPDDSLTVLFSNEEEFVYSTVQQLVN